MAKHRRHVEASPGVGSGAQRYALAVLDDVEADLSALVTEIVVPPCPRCEARSGHPHDAHAVNEPCPLT